MTEGEVSSTPSPSGSESPSTGKPNINIADILPPAPKGPPPGRGPPPPLIATIPEEEETEAPAILRTDRAENGDGATLSCASSYTVLNSLVTDKPSIDPVSLELGNDAAGKPTEMVSSSKIA